MATYAAIVYLAAASATAGLLAPHLLAAANDASSASSSPVDAHPSLVRWLVFLLVAAAIIGGLLAVLHPIVGDDPRRSPWLGASFVIVLPLLLGFLAPDIMRFLADEGALTLALAGGLWLMLFLLAFRLWPRIRDGTVTPTAGLAIILALTVFFTLYLAWERGGNLAKRAAMGDQIVVRRFNLLSVRSSVVCLEPATKGTRIDLPRRPYLYLGEAGGTLVLYDYIADLANDVPEAFPLRVPSSGIVVRTAHYNTNASQRWTCAPNA